MLTVPLITDNLAVAPIQLCMRNYSHLSSLDIADMAQDIGSDTIEVLIWSDYYWQLVSGRVIRGDDGPVALHTKLGCVLTGPAQGWAKYIKQYLSTEQVL